MSTFAQATVALWLAVFALALAQRRRGFAIAIGLFGGLHALLSTAVAPRLGLPLWVTLPLQLAAFSPLVRLPFRGLRPPWFHALVTLPGHWWLASHFLAIPWAVASAFGYALPWAWLPFGVGLAGLVDSLWVPTRVVDIVLDGTPLAQHPVRHRSPAAPRDGRPLRVVQITDPHLGPFMSARRLARVCTEALRQDPDLIVLTGDFLTFETNGDRESLKRALAPLKAAPGKVFACLGNHDHEALDVVTEALEANGVMLLVDRAFTADTHAGLVHIVGVDFRWQNREAHLADVFYRYPRPAGALRLVLLHDPGAFAHVPAGEGDLVLSGHTHGGQVGLVRVGLPYTVVSALSKVPDHGLWGRGVDRLYVHRGTGHYGFPLRVGVPAEQSVLHIHREARAPR